MTEGQWDSFMGWTVAGVFMTISFVLGIIVGSILIEYPKISNPKIEEPKPTHHLHLHMESCGQKDRFGI